MKINNCKIGLILLLSLSIMPATVFGGTNSLTQLDIRKNSTSSSAVDVTLFTAAPYNDSVAVTKKSDNKYVILMPNVSGSTGKSPDLSGLKDVISNVDIKSVNDGSASYTKVTLTTVKPLNIKTRTQNSMPVTAGQKAYRELLAQNEKQTPNSAPVVKEQPKQEVSAVKKVETSKPEEVQKLVEKPKPAVQKTSNILEKAQNSIKSVSSKKEEIPQAESVKKVEESKVQQKSAAPVTPNAVKTEPAQNSLEKVEPSVAPAPAGAAETVSLLQDTNENGRTPSNMPITIAMILIPVAGLILLFKLIKSSMTASSMLKRAFMDNIKNKKESVGDYEHIINADLNWQEKYQKFVTVSNQNHEKAPKKLISETVEFDMPAEIEASSLKPLEKEIRVVETSEKQPVNSVPKIVTKKVKKVVKSEVTIDAAVNEIEKQITKLESESSKKAVSKSVNKKEEYVHSLEKMLHNSPSTEKLEIEESKAIEEFGKSIKDVKVHSEDNMIVSHMSNVTNISKTKKLKAFANNSVLEETHRNKPVPKTREDVKRSVNREGRHVNLGYSKLHSNPRLLEGANLSAADLIAKSSRHLPNPVVPKITPVKPQQVSLPKAKPVQEVQKSTPVNSKGYSMSTLDEFFSLSDDRKKVTASEELSNRVANRLGNIKSPMKLEKHSPKKMSNPISNIKSENQENYLNGLIVKSGFNIDNEKGFYLVNNDGEMALIGRIKEEIFVLKKFDKPIEKPLQVREDNPNVYMVKTDGFRSLVEVSENKMGVLIEL